MCPFAKPTTIKQSTYKESMSQSIKSVKSDVLPDRGIFFHKIGGEKTMNKIIPIFYEKVLRSETLQKYFQSVDMTTQIQKYMSFLSITLGDSNKWNGRPLREIHKHIHVKSDDFTEFIDKFRETLLEVEINKSLTDQIIQHIISCFRKDILCV